MRPNVLFILTDDHAAHAASAYGSAVNRTPRLDEIATAGVRFDRCYCANALCTPSRAAILTGTHSHVNGVYTLSTPFASEQPTFVSALHGAGWRTGIVGKWHLGEGPEHEPRGFDMWQVLRDQGEYFDPRFLSADGERVVPGYATEVITDLALEWLDEQRTAHADAPWCLLVHHKAPHRSWEPDPRYADRYAGVDLPVPATFDDDYATRTTAAHVARMRVADDLRPEDLKREPPGGLDEHGLARWKQQRWMEDYLACIASVDDNVGRVLDDLRAHGEFEHTIVVYASDQGFFIGDHGWFDKRFMYEQSIRMPMLVSWPDRIPAGRATDTIVSNVDFAPTLLELADVPVPDRMQGTSFAAELLGGNPPPRDEQQFYYRYWEHDDSIHHALGHRGIRTDRWKLIRLGGGGHGLPGASDAVYPVEWELYDLDADPDELVNLADDPAHAAVRASLEARLDALRASLADTID